MNLLKLAIFLSIVVSQSAFAEGIRIPLEDGIDPPAQLSETGIFSGKVSDLQPTASFRAYDINQPLWVDFAQKQRWIHLPEGTKMKFSATEAYDFPVGTILVKHFRMETSRDVFRNIETRVLVKKTGDNKWVGYTYQWDGEDAKLLGAKENPSITLVIDATAFGGARTQVFKIPSRAQCLQCHSSSVGYVRSVLTRQLNRPGTVDHGNQLDDWNKKGLFDRDIGEASQYEAYAAISDQSQPLERRVKSYLEVNCAHCHNPDPEAICSFTGMDFRFDSFKAENLVSSGHLSPGAKEKSEIFVRMSSVTPFERMPFIGSVIQDEEALAAVGQWIDGLQAAEKSGLVQDTMVSRMKAGNSK